MLVAGEANISLVVVIIILTAVAFNFSDEQYLDIFWKVGGCYIENIEYFILKLII